MIWLESEGESLEQEKIQKLIEHTKELLNSSDTFEVAIGAGRREVLKEIGYWE